MQTTLRRILLTSAAVLMLANLGVKAGMAAMEPERNGRCTLTPPPIPGAPAACSCAWLSTPTDCDALAGTPYPTKCSIVDGQCVPGSP
jgi:hypothetical protein